MCNNVCVKHTCAAGLYRRVWWRRHPAGTDGSEPNPEYDHWTGTWWNAQTRGWSLCRPLTGGSVWSLLFVLYVEVSPTRVPNRTWPILPFMMIVYEGRHGADLNRVGVVGRIFKQTIIWVKEFSGNQEEELSGGSTVIQPETHQQIYPLNVITPKFCSRIILF